MKKNANKQFTENPLPDTMDEVIEEKPVICRDIRFYFAKK